jgi:signal peptidase II
VGFLLPSAIVIILDWFSKQFFWHLGRNFDVIGSILRITLVKNSGSAFGFFQGERILFVAFGSLASIVVAYLGFTTPKEAGNRRFALSLILGGALGNLIDRIHSGQVIDFIDMGIGSHRWPVYNFADIAVTVGVALLIITYLSAGKQEDGG